jgi:hypothetical protein
LVADQTNQTLSESGSPEDEIDLETIRDWKTLRRDLAFANAAISIGNAEQFVGTGYRSLGDSSLARVSKLGGVIDLTA